MEYRNEHKLFAIPRGGNLSDHYIRLYTNGSILTLADEPGYTKTDIASFKAARDAAFTSDYGSVRIGCVLRYKGKIIGSGANMCKSDPEQRHYNSLYRAFNEPRRFSPKEHSIHAEIAAIKSVPYNKAQTINWSKVKAYIYRIAPGKPGCQGLSKPCAACCHALYDKGIRMVYFSDDLGFGKLRFSDDLMEADKPANLYYKSNFPVAKKMLVSLTSPADDSYTFV